MPLALMLAGAGADVSPAAAAPSLIETDLTSAWRGEYVKRIPPGRGVTADIARPPGGRASA